MINKVRMEDIPEGNSCLLYTSDAADDGESVDLGGRRIIKKNFFKQKTAYEIMPSLVGSEMCIRDRDSLNGKIGDKSHKNFVIIEEVSDTDTEVIE